MVAGTLRLKVVKANIVQMEDLASLGDPYLTIQIEGTTVHTEPVQSTLEVVSNKQEMVVAIWN